MSGPTMNLLVVHSKKKKKKNPFLFVLCSNPKKCTQKHTTERDPQCNYVCSKYSS